MNITIILEKYCISVEKHEFKLSFFPNDLPFPHIVQP